jgi:hypothetical protein
MDFAAAVRVLLLKNTEGVFPPGFQPPVYSPLFVQTLRDTGSLPSAV